MKVEACLTENEYQTLRLADMRGKLNAVKRMTRDYENGCVTFHIDAPRKFCIQIEGLIDFGATSAAEVFNLEVAPY